MFSRLVALAAAGAALPVHAQKKLNIRVGHTGITRAPPCRRSATHMHLKDYSGGDAFLGYSPLGQGKVDIPAILAMMNGKPIDGMVMVELDSSPSMPMPALETARIARAYLLKQGVALRS